MYRRRNLLFVEPDPGTPGSGGKTFTQEDVTAVATAERDKARRAAAAEFEQRWKEKFGDVDMDTVAAKVEAAKAAEDALKSEAELALAAAQAAKAEAEAEKAAAASERHHARVTLALSAAGAGDPKLVRLVDVDQGADQATVDAAVAKLKTEYPALFGKTAPVDTDPGAPPVQTPAGKSAWDAGREQASKRFGQS